LTAPLARLVLVNTSTPQDFVLPINGERFSFTLTPSKAKAADGATVVILEISQAEIPAYNLIPGFDEEAV